MHLRPLHFPSRPSPLSLPALRKLRGTVAEQCSRENPMFYGLSFKTLFRRFEIFFHARPALPKKLQGAGNSRVTIPHTRCLFFQAFQPGIVTASGDTFITKNIYSSRHSRPSSPPPPLRPLRTLWFHCPAAPLPWRFAACKMSLSRRLFKSNSTRNKRKIVRFLN